MIDNTIQARAGAPSSRSAAVSDLAERWAGLNSAERCLLVLAVDAMHAGTFDRPGSWERFVEAALELLPTLETGALSPKEVHDFALVRAGVSTST
jgi:hypothetical protein